MYTIVVIDGKGGGIGSSIVKRLSSMNDVKIIALGTNSQATVNMLKSGAHDGATGENAICHMVEKVDMIVGPMAIVVSNSMMGEITPRIAQAIANSDAQKLLLPTQKCGISVIGVEQMTMAQMIDRIPDAVNKLIK